MKIFAGLICATLLVFGALWAMQLDQEANSELVMEQARAALTKPYVCPPCGMTMAESSLLQQFDGYEYAVCGPRCSEILAMDPANFAEHAVGPKDE